MLQTILLASTFSVAHMDGGPHSQLFANGDGAWSRLNDACDEQPHQAQVMPEHLCSHAAAELRRLMPRPHDGEEGVAGTTDGLTDVLHYNLDLEIVPSNTTLIGTNIITVKSLVNGLTTFDLSLHQNFAVPLLQVNNANAPYSRNGAIVHITLDRVYNVNEAFEVKISYSGVPVSGGFGSINFTTQNGQTLVFTLSEPYFAYTWWPVKEDNRDKATGDMAFTVPNTLKVCSNGLLQGVDVLAGNKLRYRWHTNYPTAPYLFCFSATNYNQFSDTWIYSQPGGGIISMPLQFYIYPASDTTTNRNAWLASKTMLTTFSDLFGIYPFTNEKYGIYQFGFGGGMEHQTMTGQGTFSNSTTAHELAHQWWGDKVTCGDFHHIWLNEGFADYCEALWAEFQPGSTGTPALLSAMAARRPSTMDTIVYRYDISSASVIFNTNAVYYKGGWVLHMLRHIMGDANFFNALRTYSDTFAYDNAVTEDFQAVAESHYGSSLSWFFQPWIYQTGAPTYQSAYRNVTVAGQNYLELYMKQNQNVAWPTFRMPVDVRVTIGGVQSFITVWNDERAEHLLVPVSGSVTALAVDPNNYVLHPTPTTTTFVEGPPKIVSIAPALGASVDAADVPNVRIVFHKNVNATAASFVIQGANVGSVPFTFAYDSATFTATLTPNSTLASDTYTLTVNAAGVTGVAGGLALDGEIADPNNPSSLPSGNGLPGGNAVAAFTIIGQPPPACSADIATPHDGYVTIDDLFAVIAAWGPCPVPPTACPADIAPSGGNGYVNIDDLFEVITAWGPCP
jgi:aminopeptidase N